MIINNATISFKSLMQASIFGSIFQLSWSSTSCCYCRKWPSGVLYCSAVAKSQYKL